MIRILGFLAVVFVLGMGFAWLADRPGDLLMTFDGYQYRVSLMVAAVIVTAIVAGVMIVWWLCKAIWTSPQTITRYFRVRRRDRGYQALSTGLIAAGAGDFDTARRKKQEATKLISSDSEPLIHLLAAQTALLEGDHAAAREKFEAMLDDPEMKLLGLRGLYLEAQRLGEREVAQHYAARAAEAAPQLAWASTAALEARTAARDWDAGLRLLESQRSTRQIERDAAARRKAVLLTAKAMDMLEADPVAAKNAALEANRLAPDLVPAAVVAARALLRLNDLKKGAKILEAAWKKEPHPEIAELYVQARPGDSTHDRLERAKRLRSLRTNNAESAMVVARTALEAGEFRLAREEAETAARLSPREGVYLLLADIEEAETGDQGRIRQYLAKALAAPRDPSWVADGVVSERWAPASPVTGRLDAYEWRGPEERIGRVIEHGSSDDVPAAHRDEAPVPQLTVVPPATVEPVRADGPVIEAVQPAPVVAPVETPAPPEPTDAAKAERIPESPQLVSETEPPRPDDPGVPPEEPDVSQRRFKLF